MNQNQIIYKIAAQQLGLPEELVESVYSEYWKEIRRLVVQNKIELDMPEKEFNRVKRNVNIQNFGKLSCTYQHYLRKIHNTKSRTEYYENQKNNTPS